MSAHLPERLRDLRRLLAQADPDVAELAAAAQRLDRDLLPRTAGGTAPLVVGVVGPNNAGKSTLVNALVGREVSPALATGGATRRLIGVAHPQLRARLEAEPTLARFALRRVEGVGPVEDALATPADPAELALVDEPGLPDGLLLVDTPDFDSVLRENRSASEALLRVTDVALVVVTRHSYQNQDVVAYLVEWLSHGRPWILVYNESVDADTTRDHAAKLAEDVGQPPEACFHAEHDREVAGGQVALLPRALTGAPAGAPLRGWLMDLPRQSELKRRALKSSLGQLADEVTAGIARLDARAQRAGRLEAVVERHTLELGRGVAGAAMPMGPFLEAFRAVLDRRPGWLPRGYRGLLRRGRLALQSAWARLAGKGSGAAQEGDPQLEAAERQGLSSRWPRFFEALADDLGRVTREEEAGDLADLLAADLAPARLGEAEAQVDADLGGDPEVTRAFREAMEERIERELDQRHDEIFLQAAVDALHLLPAVAAGVVIVQTGGLGADVAVGGAGAVSTLLAERLSRLLGRPVAQAARERWIELEGARVAALARSAALPRLAPRLEQEGHRSREAAEALSEALTGLGDLEHV